MKSVVDIETVKDGESGDWIDSANESAEHEGMNERHFGSEEVEAATNDESADESSKDGEN